MIYISHPYGGLEENKEHIEKIITALTELYPKETFVSPVHCFGFLYETVPYEKGISYCLNLLEKCESVLVCGDYLKSDGCKIEIDYCNDVGVTYAIIPHKEIADCERCFYTGKCETECNCRRLVNATLGASIETDLKTRITCKNFIDKGDLYAAKELTERDW